MNADLVVTRVMFGQRGNWNPHNTKRITTTFWNYACVASGWDSKICMCSEASPFLVLFSCGSDSSAHRLCCDLSLQWVAAVPGFGCCEVKNRALVGTEFCKP